MEMDFVLLTSTFMNFFEDIIFGKDFPEIQYLKELIVRK